MNVTSKDINMDELFEAIKTAVVALFVWLVGAFIDNPVGTFSSIVGLLYIYDKWRTQRNLRKQSEIDLDNKIKNQEKDGSNS